MTEPKKHRVGSGLARRIAYGSSVADPFSESTIEALARHLDPQGRPVDVHKPYRISNVEFHFIHDDRSLAAYADEINPPRKDTLIFVLANKRSRFDYLHEAYELSVRGVVLLNASADELIDQARRIRRHEVLRNS